jgi:hypothetical protein
MNDNNPSPDALPVIEADWAAMQSDDQRDYYGENGFILVPDALSPDVVGQLHCDIEAVGTPLRVDEEVWDFPAFVKALENPKMLAAMRNILGPDLRFFKGAYLASPPGTPRQTLHVDHNMCAFEGDARNTCASWANVGFYLTDLSPEHGPLWVVPGSNKRYHLQPQTNYDYLLPEAKMVLAKAGDAVIFHRSTVHAGGANTSSRIRHGLFLSFRPAWAKPTGPVPNWAPERVEKVSLANRSLVGDLNVGR